MVQIAAPGTIHQQLEILTQSCLGRNGQFSGFIQEDYANTVVAAGLTEALASSLNQPLAIFLSGYKLADISDGPQ